LTHSEELKFWFMLYLRKFHEIAVKVSVEI